VVTTVQTVRGPLETTDPGTTLVHEHVFVLTPDMLADYPTGPRSGWTLTRVVIGHCGDSADIGHLEGLAQRRSLLGMDRFGLDAILPFEQRVETVAHLCRLGYADRLVLSQDASLLIDCPGHGSRPP
jgi:predicted metal-dependent phosphotriesterase family hydrolase